MTGTFRKLYLLMTPGERKLFALLLPVTVLSAGLQMAGVALVYPFLLILTEAEGIRDNRFVAMAAGALRLESQTELLLAASLVVLGALLVANLLLIGVEWFQIRFFWKVQESMSVRLFRRYLSMDYTFFLQSNTSTLGKNVLHEVQQVTAALMYPTMDLLTKSLIVGAMALLLVLLEPWAALIVVLTLGGGYGLFYVAVRGRLARMGNSYLEANQQRFKAVGEAFGAIKEVKAQGTEDDLANTLQDPAARFARAFSFSQVLQRLPKYALETFAFGGLIVVFIYFLMTGREYSSMISIMGVFAVAGYRMFPALRDCVSAMTTIRFNRGPVDAIYRDLKPQPGEGMGRSAGEPVAFRREIQVQGVSFAFPGAPNAVLRDVNLSLPKNRSVAFVGRTGSGKTTLVDLIVGLFAPTSGKILVDGVEIGLQNQRAWRRKIGYVPQDVFLFDDSIRRNIAFGVPAAEIDDEAVVQAAKAAQIYEFIDAHLPDKYETIVGEKGIRLSGGQRQRIGIARALYRNPEILVLDEATSDVDNVTEAAIGHAIQGLSGQKTLLIVAHRFSTIRYCDVIHMVEDGAIVASGTYDELLAGNAGFRALARGHLDDGEFGSEIAPLEAGALVD